MILLQPSLRHFIGFGSDGETHPNSQAAPTDAQLLL
jgi:hypothetical protein